MSSLIADLRYGLRLLAKDRSFTITALLTLAVCIGANAAMFSVIRSVLLKPLPFPNSGQVVLMYNSYPNAGAARVGAATPDLIDRQEGVKSATDFALFQRQGLTYGTETEGVIRLIGIRATPSFFKVVPIAPIHGRVFDENDGKPGQNQKVLLSYGFWKRNLGGRDDVVGQQLKLSNQPLEIVGVLPQSFSFLQSDVEVFLPTAFAPADFADDRRHNNNWQMLARMAPGVDVPLIQQQVDAVNARNNERFPQFRQILADAKFKTVVVRLQDDLVRDIKGSLYLLWGGVLFVLVIGCVNLANLMIVRSASRSREMATRHALGGEMGRLARQLLTETTTLSLVGGGLGVLLAWWGTRSVASLNLDQLPRGYEIQLDPLGLSFAFILTVGVGIVLGVAPALRLRKMNLNVELREESRGGTSGRRAQQVRRVLAMAQVAIALVLLIGAGLLLASFRQVMNRDFGFKTENVTTATVNLPGSYTPVQRGNFLTLALERLREIPGVVSVGGVAPVPFSNNVNPNVILGEGHVMKPGESLAAPARVVAAPGYFETIQARLVKGRPFGISDTPESPRVAIIDNTLAEHYWPGQDAVGRRLYFPGNMQNPQQITPQTQFLNVIGVVQEIMVTDPKSDLIPIGTYFLPATQLQAGGLTYMVRTSSPSATIASDIKNKIKSIDAQLPVFQLQPMQQWIDRAMVGRRAPMLIAAGFSAVALFLAAIGIYGVLAYGVSERKRELGVRMALGGTTGSIFRLVLNDGVLIMVVGVVGGLIGSYFVGRLMQALLYGVTPMNVAVIGMVTAVLAGVALLASGIPALRASRIDPIVVLSR